MATSPTPEPISRTRCPRDMPAFLNKRSVNGLKILACRLSRSCSRPVPPSTYDVPGEEIVISTTLQSYCVARICVGRHSPTPRVMSGKKVYHKLGRELYRTWRSTVPLLDVRFGSKADIAAPPTNVRFT